MHVYNSCKIPSLKKGWDTSQIKETKKGSTKSARWALSGTPGTREECGPDVGSTVNLVSRVDGQELRSLFRTYTLKTPSRTQRGNENFVYCSEKQQDLSCLFWVLAGKIYLPYENFKWSLGLEYELSWSAFGKNQKQEISRITGPWPVETIAIWREIDTQQGKKIQLRMHGETKVITKITKEENVKISEH